MRKDIAGQSNRGRGFTLLEIVITLLILGVLAALVGRPIVSLVQTRLQIGEAAARQADIDYALTRMTTQIRQSDRDTDILCTNGELEVTVDGETTRYQLNGQQLVVDPGTDAEELIGGLANTDGFVCTGPENGLRLYRVALKAGDRVYEATAFKRQP